MDRRHLRGSDPNDREVVDEVTERLARVIDELEQPSTPRPLLSYPDHIHRQHRLLPALVTLDSWFRDVRFQHDRMGRCRWCHPADAAPCWAHQIARQLIGES